MGVKRVVGVIKGLLLKELKDDDRRGSRGHMAEGRAGLEGWGHIPSVLPALSRIHTPS